MARPSAPILTPYTSEAAPNTAEAKFGAENQHLEDSENYVQEQAQVPDFHSQYTNVIHRSVQVIQADKFITGALCRPITSTVSPCLVFLREKTVH